MAAELISGKHYLSFFRKLKDMKVKDADRVKFITEMSLNMEKESDAKTTVDGIVTSIADGENKIEFTSLAYRDKESTTIEFWKELRQWFVDGETVEVWNVDIESGKENPDNENKVEYNVDYFQGKFTSFELSSPADGTVELTYSYAINGRGVLNHKDVLTDEQKKAVQAAQYAYQKLAKSNSI